MRTYLLGLCSLAFCAVTGFAQNPPSDLAGTVDQNTGGVTLTWSAPAATSAILPQPIFNPEIENPDGRQRTPRLRVDPRILSEAFPPVNSTDELDEFIEYRVYRNGVLIGSAAEETYFDLMPHHGGFQYEVTAYYSDGESEPAGPIALVWFEPEDWALQEDFDNGWPTGWTVITTAPSGTWHIDNLNDHYSRHLFDTPYMLVDSDRPGSGVHVRERLKSPGIEITEAAAILLRYDYYFLEYTNEIMETSWSLNLGSSWTVFETVNETTDDIQSVVFNLTDDLIGEEDVMFSWYYDDLGNWGWYAGVDNVDVIADITPPISFELDPQVTMLPAEGGDIVYNVRLRGQLAQPYTYATYWTRIVLPNGHIPEPLTMVSICIPSYFNYHVYGLTQHVPENAPAGFYSFMARVGAYNNPSLQLWDHFTVYKQGATSDAEFVFNPEDWYATGHERLAQLGVEENGDVVNLPTEYAMASAYPNPFNPSTTVAVALPEASDLKVQVYNVTGQLVTELANGRYTAGEHKLNFDAHNLASGLYFVRATVPGMLNATQKVMLVR